MAGEPVPLRVGSGDSAGPLAPLTARVAADALHEVRDLVRDWLPGGKWHAHIYQVSNPRSGRGPASTIVLDTLTGAWGVFAGESLARHAGGGDLIGLHAYLHGTDRLAALWALAVRLGIPVKTEPAAPVVSRRAI